MPESFLAVKRIVLVFYAEHSAIANLAQMANVLAPADFAIAGNRVAPPAVSQDANILPPLRRDIAAAWASAALSRASRE